ncbi:ATP-binding protein [Undibacterium sp. Di27W]|uniref:ATP-binding protein n=1 Tax=Undibacterium sp. Di27W TaxID=3413036 RepID=UPI003BF3C21C
MRLTIARKLALAITAIVIISIGTLAWVTSQNLKSGFIAYLSDLERQDLVRLSKLLAEDYRQNGNFDRFQANRRPMRDLLDQIRNQPRPENEDAPAPPPRRRQREAAADDRGDRDERRPPPPPRAQDRPPRDAPPEQRPPIDPMGFGQRLSLIDKHGTALIGPGDAPGGSIQAIMLGNERIGTIRLAPLRQISNASAIDFVSVQIRHTLWLALTLILVALVFSLWLARHLLRPLKSLHQVTAKISKGQLDARAEIISQDELGDLARDINSMAQNLERNETQRSKMLADISHELRTPLTVIQGEIEALIDGVRHITPAALESLHAEVRHLNKLVDDIRQLTLADSGDLHYQFVAMDLRPLLADLLQRFALRIEQAGLRLESQLDDMPAWIRADGGRLTQVLGNLLENCIRYTDSGGQIVCSLQRNGALLELSLEDSAPGVADGKHALLFDRLYRADNARSRANGGSGLGLSICKVIVEAHGGRISATASQLGGVKILIQLPYIKTP